MIKTRLAAIGLVLLAVLVFSCIPAETIAAAKPIDIVLHLAPVKQEVYAPLNGLESILGYDQRRLARQISTQLEVARLIGHSAEWGIGYGNSCVWNYVTIWITHNPSDAGLALRGTVPNQRLVGCFARLSAAISQTGAVRPLVRQSACSQGNYLSIVRRWANLANQFFE